MICEIEVRPRQADLWHMARDALRFGGVTNLLRLRAGVAGETLGVIGGRRFHEFGMRIVTRGTGDAAILSIEAFAVRDAIRLEADVQRSSESHLRNLSPCPVARAAKLIGFLG